MGSLAERLKELRSLNDREQTQTVSELKTLVGQIPKVDESDIKDFLANALLAMFNQQNAMLASREAKHEQVAKGQEEVISSQQEVVKAISEANKAIEAGIESVKKEVSSIDIPETDLSNVLKAINNIKPTDISNLTASVLRLEGLISEIDTEVSIPEMDLKPILSAIEKINKPKTVEFEVVSDAYGYPVKVIASEK